MPVEPLWHYMQETVAIENAWIDHSVIHFTTGQRTLQYCSDVLETVVLVNPSEETAVSEVNGISCTYCKQDHVLERLGLQCQFYRFRQTCILVFRSCILLPGSQDPAVCLHMSSVSFNQIRSLITDSSVNKLLVLSGQSSEQGGDVLLESGAISSEHFANIISNPEVSRV